MHMHKTDTECMFLIFHLFERLVGSQMFALLASLIDYFY